MPATRSFGSAAEAVETMRVGSRVWQELTTELSAAELEQFWADVLKDLRCFEQPGGCEVPGEVLVASGSR